MGASEPIQRSLSLSVRAYVAVTAVIMSLAAPVSASEEINGEQVDKYSKTCPGGWLAPQTRQHEPKRGTDVNPLSAEGSRAEPNFAREPLRAIGAVWRPRNQLATATLVAHDFVLTTSHKIASTESLADHVFAIDWSIDYSKRRSAIILKSNEGRHVRCFPLLPADMVGSPPGHLDYLLIRIGRDNEKKLPGDYGVRPLAPAAVKELPAVGATVYLVGAHPYESVVSGDSRPEGSVVVDNGIVRRVARWNKDAGASRHVDYSIYSTPGLSGSPLFNAENQWFAMHQRDLNLAKCDSFTPWHPYVSEYYLDRFAGNSLAEQVANECHGRLPPGRPRDGDFARKYELPRQGTPLLDIVQDIVQRRGMAWACSSVPKLAAILPKIDVYSCESARRAKAERLFHASGATGGDASSTSTGSDR